MHLRVTDDYERRRASDPALSIGLIYYLQNDNHDDGDDDDGGGGNGDDDDDDDDGDGYSALSIGLIYY